MSSKPQDLRPWTQIYTSALQQGEQPSLEKTNPSVLGREPGTVFPTEWATVNWLASKDGSDDSSQSLSEGSHPQETLWTPHLLQGSTVPRPSVCPFWEDSNHLICIKLCLHPRASSPLGGVSLSLGQPPAAQSPCWPEGDLSCSWPMLASLPPGSPGD